MNKTIDITQNLIRISQGQLNLLATCPPKFQQIYLDRLSSPLSPEQQEKQAWGSRFHLLMQQKELGLSVESILKEDRELKHSIDALINATPEIWYCDRETKRYAEHYRTLQFDRYLFSVIYDLLITDNSGAKIVDWKTYLQPENPIKLANNWQTRLYLYVLAETSDYLPEEISMTYWFVKLPHRPQSLTFTYNSSQHQQTCQDLSDLLTKLDRWQSDYFDRNIPFPHQSGCQNNCPYYQSFLAAKEILNFHPLSNQDWLAKIAEIEEVVLE